jgi:hypothetical protein
VNDQKPSVNDSRRYVPNRNTCTTSISTRSPTRAVDTGSSCTPFMANHAVPPTAGGATRIARVGVSASGSGGKNASRASSTVTITTQKNTPTANVAKAMPGRPSRAVVIDAMKAPATVGSR